MRFWGRHVLWSGVFLALVGTLACNTTKKQSHSGKKPSAAATDDDNQTDTNPSTSDTAQQGTTPVTQVAQTFRIFDETYDYSPADSFSASDLARRHPVYGPTGSWIAILHEPQDFYQARMHLLNQATRSVRVQSLLFTSDESGGRISEKLVELAKRNIDVTVIVDPILAYRPEDQQLYTYLRANGVRVEGFEYLYMNYLSYLSQRNDFGVGVNEANMRYHEKLFIIDAEIPAKAMAITGGSNIANEYFGIDKESPHDMWWDKDVIVKGDVVDNLRETFDLNVATFEAADTTQSSWDGVWNILAGLFVDDDEAPADKNRPHLHQRLTEIEQRPWQVDWHETTMRFLHSRPRMDEDLIETAYLDFVKSATSEILICNSYFVPSEDMINALTAAAKRGVKVRILTNAEETLDIKKVAVVGRTYYSQLLAANDGNSTSGSLEIYEWGGEPLLRNGLGQNHAKYAVFDRKAAIVGSYNLDPRSRYSNAETIMAFAGQEVVKPLITEFEEFITPTYAQMISRGQADEFSSPGSVGEDLKTQFFDYFKAFL